MNNFNWFNNHVAKQNPVVQSHKSSDKEDWQNQI